MSTAALVSGVHATDDALSSYAPAHSCCVVATAGYFDVKPSRCTKCGNSDCFDPVPQQVQNLNYITIGGALNSLQA